MIFEMQGKGSEGDEDEGVGGASDELTIGNIYGDSILQWLFKHFVLTFINLIHLFRRIFCTTNSILWRIKIKLREYLKSNTRLFPIKFDKIDNRFPKNRPLTR